ncbi:hypothetical protein IAT38_006466 [Cryptococcus sp. DSM 104549]
MPTLLTLPPQLREAIIDILTLGEDLPADLRDSLAAAADSQAVSLDPPVLADVDAAVEPEETVSGPKDESEDVVEKPLEFAVVPPTIELEVVERLSRWATGQKGLAALKRHGLNPSRYMDVSLLSGTEIYIPPAELERLRAAEDSSKPNPFIPSYLSPAPPSFGSEYRSLLRTLSTTINILFSIFGSAAAVYVASVTGAGYSRERGIILGVLAGLVVGIADVVLMWLFTGRVEDARKERHNRGAAMMKGSGAVVGDVEGEEKGVLAVEGGDTAMPEAPKKQIQLRRRALKEQTA